jgi:hypothetical protein
MCDLGMMLAQADGNGGILQSPCQSGLQDLRCPRSTAFFSALHLQRGPVERMHRGARYAEKMFVGR